MPKNKLKLFLLLAFVFLGSLDFISSAQATHQCEYGSVKHFADDSCIGSFTNLIGVCGNKPCGLGCSEPDGLPSESYEFMSIANPDSTTCDHMPIANAGPDQTVTDSAPLGTESITLDGSGSTDPNNDITSYEWTDGATLLGTGMVLVKTLGIGVHTITLTVTDSTFNSDTDTVVITIIPVFALSVSHTCSISNCPTDPPTIADTVTFIATATHSLPIDFSTYVILISLDTGLGCVSFTPYSCGSDPCSVGPLGSYPDGQKVCYYGTFKDTAGNQAWASVKNFIVTSNKPPVANPGPNITIIDGSAADMDGIVNGEVKLTLDGSASTDPDGFITKYEWFKGATKLGEGVTITVTLPVGLNAMSLKVTDNEGATHIAGFFVTVEKGCSDPDTNDATKQGLCTDKVGSFTDFCSVLTEVDEFQCVSNLCKSSKLPCGATKECKFGACVDIAAVCTDPDGSNTAIQGTCTDATGPKTDSCDSITNVKEFQCVGPTCTASSVSCGSGKECTDGKCVDVLPPPPPPCGGLGQPCCASGNPCPGLTCDAGTCKTPPPPPPTCPNSICGVGETCSNCAADCGVCPPLPPPPPPSPTCVSPNSCIASSACSTGKTLDTCPVIGDVCCLPPPPPPAGKSGGLVPCGRIIDIGTPNQNCTFCHFFVLFKNIIDFIMWTLAPILGVLLIVLGGFLILTSRGSSTQYNQGKMFIIWALGGFVLILIAWILINSVFSVLKLQDWTGLQVGKWWQVTCNVSAVAKANVLWLANDTVGSVFKTDTAGAILAEIPATPVSGIAFDGASLYFGNADGSITKRTSDGVTVIDSFSIAPIGNPTEDMAWDTKRLRLWRIEHNPPTVVKINPVTKTKEATYPIDPADPEIFPRGGLGIAYDKTRDVLYISFCQAGCAILSKGLVLIMNPDTGVITDELFRTVGFATGGLGYDPTTDTLWVGDVTLVRNMSLTGAILSSFIRPNPGGFVDGLEFIN